MSYGRRAGTALTVAALVVLVGGCTPSDDDKAETDSVGCELSSAAVLEKALGSDQLSSTGGGSIKEPDPKTGLVTCDTYRTDRTGYTVYVQVQRASTADLKSRENWLSSKPRANPGCQDPGFLKDDQLAGVSCVEPAAEGEGTRVYVVSTTHTIVAELSLAAAATTADREAAFAIAQSVQSTIE